MHETHGKVVMFLRSIDYQRWIVVQYCTWLCQYSITEMKWQPYALVVRNISMQKRRLARNSISISQKQTRVLGKLRLDQNAGKHKAEARKEDYPSSLWAFAYERCQPPKR